MPFSVCGRMHFSLCANIPIHDHMGSIYLTFLYPLRLMALYNHIMTANPIKEPMSIVVIFTALDSSSSADSVSGIENGAT